MTQPPTTGLGRPAATRVAVLVSGSGTLLQALIDGQKAELDPAYAVVAVLADRPDAGGLARARQAGIPTAVVELADFPDRDTWNLAVARTLEAFRPELVVLAGFMRILGEPTLSRYAGRMINMQLVSTKRSPSTS